MAPPRREARRREKRGTTSPRLRTKRRAPRGEHPGEEEEVEAVGQGGVAPKAQAKAAQEGPFRPGVRLGHAPLKEEVGEEEEP